MNMYTLISNLKHICTELIVYDNHIVITNTGYVDWSAQGLRYMKIAKLQLHTAEPLDTTLTHHFLHPP